MRYLFLLLSLLFITQTGEAQDQTRTLSISATGKVELPADRVQFNININAEADTPQKAYKLHKEREKALVQLLDTYNIKEEDISYQPISISEQRNYNRESDNEPVIQTRQTVNVILRDFEVYEKIQIGLIESNFNDFSGSFAADKMEKGKENALRNAVQEAKEKAKLLAEEAGATVGAVTQISYNYSQPQPYARETMEMKASSDSGSLMKYNQTVSVSATVSMQFQISE